MAHRRLIPLALASASLLALGACDDPVRPLPREISVAILNAPDSMGVGDSLKLLAGVLSSDPHWGAQPEFTSRAPGIVALDSAGHARGVAVGQAWVVAHPAGLARDVAADSVLIVITAQSRSLLATVARDSLAPGDTVTVRTVVNDLFGTAPAAGTIRFASSDTLVARVDSLTGLVRILSDGDITITGRAGMRVASAALGSWLQPLATNGVRLTKVAFGWSFGCGLDAAGVAYCWGYNGTGQLGLGTTGGGPFPLAPVQTAERFVTIAAGRGTACGITAAGALVCWGRSLSGIRPTVERGVPTTIPMPAGMGPVVRAFGGVRAAMCAVDVSNVHACFGDNSYKQIGEDVTTVTTARAVPGAPAQLTSLATGELHGCGTTPAGALWCWGDDASWGTPQQLGYVAPVQVAGVPALQKVTTNFQSTCALDTAGAVWCGGFESGDMIVPMTKVAGTPAFVRFESGLQNDCGLTADGALWCRESPNFVVSPRILGGGQTFVPFSRRHTFTEFSVGHVGVCGITTAGATICRAAMGGLQ
jgi:hypothetical protein